MTAEHAAARGRDVGAGAADHREGGDERGLVGGGVELRAPLHREAERRSVGEGEREEPGERAAPVDVVDAREHLDVDRLVVETRRAGQLVPPVGLVAVGACVVQGA